MRTYGGRKELTRHRGVLGPDAPLHPLRDDAVASLVVPPLCPLRPEGAPRPLARLGDGQAGQGGASGGGLVVCGAVVELGGSVGEACVCSECSGHQSRQVVDWSSTVEWEEGAPSRPACPVNRHRGRQPTPPSQPQLYIPPYPPPHFSSPPSLTHNAQPTTTRPRP